MDEPSALGQELRLIACRIREKYDLDSVVILTGKQENVDDHYETITEFALSGNHYAAKTLARKYGE
jgi:hypothetical protein